MLFLCSISFSPNSNNDKIDILHNNFGCLFGPWTNNAIHINTFIRFILQHDQKTTVKSASHILFLTFCIRYYLWSYYEWLSIILWQIAWVQYCSMHYASPSSSFSNSATFHFIHFSHCIAAGLVFNTRLILWYTTLCCWCENYIRHSLCIWECVNGKW